MDFLEILPLYEILTITSRLRGTDLLVLCKVNKLYRFFFGQQIFWDQATNLEFKKDAKRWENKERKHHPEIIQLSRRDQWPTANPEVLEDPWGTKKALGPILDPSWVCVNIKDKEVWIPCPDFAYEEELVRWKYLDLGVYLSNQYCPHQKNLRRILKNARARVWSLEQEGQRLHERRLHGSLYRIDAPINAGLTKDQLAGIQVFRQLWAEKGRQVEKEIFLAMSIALKSCRKMSWDRRLMKKYQRLLIRLGEIEQCNATLKMKLRKASYQLQLSTTNSNPLAYI